MRLIVPRSGASRADRRDARASATAVRHLQTVSARGCGATPTGQITVRDGGRD